VLVVVKAVLLTLPSSNTIRIVSIFG
jgi:hypothetical protein